MPSVVIKVGKEGADTPLAVKHTAEEAQIASGTLEERRDSCPGFRALSRVIRTLPIGTIRAPRRAPGRQPIHRTSRTSTRVAPPGSGR